MPLEREGLFGGPAVGDRVQFALPSPQPGGPIMAGEGFVLARIDPTVFVGVLGYPNVLTLPLEACKVVEAGALVRRVALA